MVCKLPKCIKRLPKGKRSYCCPEHAKIGAANSCIIKEKKPCEEARLCSVKGCNRLYTTPNAENKCYQCRSGANGHCHREGCGRPIPRSRTSRALFCSDPCRDTQRLTEKALWRKKAASEKHDCASDGCKNKFIKTANAQKFCPKCQEEGNPYGLSPDYTEKRRADDGLVAVGKFFEDFRKDICKSGGKICAGYQKCSDSVMFNKHGMFEYQRNGGNNCYKEPASIYRVNSPNSFAVCSVNSR